MLVYRAFALAVKLLVSLFFTPVKRRRRKIRNAYREYFRIFRFFRVFAKRKRKPEQVVGIARAKPRFLSAVNVPPVSNVALGVLVRGATEYLLSAKRGRVFDKRKAVLKLIAETVSSAYLIKARARKEA